MGAVDVRERERHAHRSRPLGFLFAGARRVARRAGHLDFKVVERHDFGSGFAFDADQAAFETAAARFGKAFGLQGREELRVHELTREALPVAGALQGALHAGRRHLKAFVRDILHGEEVRELVAHAFAVFKRDAAFGLGVDRHAHEAAGEAFEFDELVAHPLDGAFNDVVQRSGLSHKRVFYPFHVRPADLPVGVRTIKKKWAPKCPFHMNPDRQTSALPSKRMVFRRPGWRHLPLPAAPGVNALFEGATLRGPVGRRKAYDRSGLAVGLLEEAPGHAARKRMGGKSCTDR